MTIRDGLGEDMPFPGIGYLGIGYDILKGNPGGNSNSLIDPGFRGSVIALKWVQDSRYNARDMQRLEPLQSTGTPVVACQHATTATQISSMDDYSHSLETGEDQCVGAGKDQIAG